MGEPNERDDDQYARRLDAEWIAANALREVIGIAQKHTPTYSDTIEIASSIAPNLFSEGSFLLAANESLLVRQYRQKADVMREVRGTEVTPLEAIDEDIEDYEGLLHVSEKNNTLLWRHLNRLKNARARLIQDRYTESQSILRDIYDAERDLPITGKGKGYRDFQVTDDRGLRIRLLHPDPPESALGADVIYESHWTSRKMVRIVAVQYKMWNSERLYLSQSGNLQEQLDKLNETLCSRDLCKAFSKSKRKDAYRLPFCAAFLRPTDKIQSADQRLQSSGYHIPICAVARSWTVTSKGGKMLESKIIRGESVTHRVFEELFNNGMLGSRWLTYPEIEALYQGTGILDGTDQIRIHAQEFGI
jgi:hypothetical protein